MTIFVRETEIRIIPKGTTQNDNFLLLKRNIINSYAEHENKKYVLGGGVWRGNKKNNLQSPKKLPLKKKKKILCEIILIPSTSEVIFRNPFPVTTLRLQ